MTAKFFTKTFALLLLSIFTLAVSAPSVIAQSSITGSYDFSWRADKTDQTIALSGSVPSEQIQRFLIIRAGENASNTLRVARGAPENFISSSIAGLDALKHLDSGSFFLADNIWTLAGTAVSQSQKDDMLAVLTLATNTQDWEIDISFKTGPIITAQAPAIEPAQLVSPQTHTQAQPEPAQFRWAVQKNIDGAFRFSGNVPSLELQQFLTLRAKQVSRDITQVGEGAPKGFMASALAAIEALRELKTGRVVFASDKWTIYGVAENQDALRQAQTDLSNVANFNAWAVSLEVEAPKEIALIEQPVAPVEPAPIAEQEPVIEQPQEPKIKLTIVTGDPNYQFNALRADGGLISLSGMLPTNEFANYIGALAQTDQLNSIIIAHETPENFRINAISGIKALSQLRSGLLAYENSVWTLVGDAMNQRVQNNVRSDILDLKDAQNWVLNIAKVPALDICKISVAQFSQTKTILFAPASANLTAGSKQNVDELAITLNNCVSTIIHVSGHTDADGPANDNMALSVARAESVVNALITSGVDVSRLFAVGYGETLPVASNDTRAGKAQNRRIVFELSAE